MICTWNQLMQVPAASSCPLQTSSSPPAATVALTAKVELSPTSMPITDLDALSAFLSRHTLHVNDVAATLMNPRIAGSIGEANTCTVFPIYVTWPPTG